MFIHPKPFFKGLTSFFKPVKYLKGILIKTFYLIDYNFKYQKAGVVLGKDEIIR